MPNRVRDLWFSAEKSIGAKTWSPNDGKPQIPISGFGGTFGPRSGSKINSLREG